MQKKFDYLKGVVKKPRVNHEASEQRALVIYLELKGLKFSSLPLSTYTTSYSQKNFNKAQGVRAGVPDIMIIIKNKLIFIEMKRVKGGRLSKEQKEWLEELNKCNEVSAYCCNGFEQARKVIDKYLKK